MLEIRIDSRKLICIALIFTLFTFIVACEAESDSFNISGQVIDLSGNGVEDVNINIDDEILKTDKEGRFSKTSIQDKITLKPSKDGYKLNVEKKEVISKRNDIEFIAEDIGNNNVEYIENFNGEIKVHFIDVGQGDSILIEAIDDGQRYKMLIDAGTRSAGSKVINYMKDLDIETVHIAVGTHAHADHVGGLIEVFETFAVKKVIDPGLVHYTITFEDYLTAIAENNIEFIEGRAGMKMELAAGLYFDILHPDEPLNNDLNDESIVGQLRYKDIGFIFTGDVEENGENAILNRNYDIENQILKVGHHGSSTSTTKQFLEAVNPEVAIIQVGEDNRYDHPSNEIINRLNNLGVEIYRNDYHGDVVVTTDGNSYIVNKEPYEPEEEDEEITEKININTADYERLQEITGVGPAIANNIIEYRQINGKFSSIEEIKEVSGIGDVKFGDIKDDIII